MTKLKKPLTKEINDKHAAALNSAKNAVLLATECGELLIKQKAAVKHGEWEAWVKENFNGGLRTAFRYIALGSNRPRVADLLEQNPEAGQMQIVQQLNQENKPKPKPPTRPVQDTPKPEKPKNVGWVQAIVNRIGTNVPGWKVGTLRNKKSQIEKMVGYPFASMLEPEDAVSLGDAIAKIIANERPAEAVAAAQAAAQAAREALSKTAAEKLDKAKEAEIASLRLEFRYQVQEEAKKRAPEIRLHMEKKIEEAGLEKDRYAAMCKKLDTLMTEDEYKMIQSCLHPDKHPENKAKYEKAFKIFRRLLLSINWAKTPKELLRNNWSKKSSLNPFR